MPERVIVVTGPTATGKTALGVELAKLYSGEVVSADSMQIYKEMNIGTAKVTADEMQGVRHHMIDVAEPWESYSVARYVDEAAKCCDDILSRGKLPIIVGGTGLYIDSLLSGREFADSGDISARERISMQYDELGGTQMLEKLRRIDPQRAEKLSANDKRRIVRALEIYETTGKTITEHDEATCSVPPRYSSNIISLDFVERKDLYDRIDKRVDSMVQAGLFEEVSGLMDKYIMQNESGIDVGKTAFQAIGYKEVIMSLKGEISKEEAIEIIKRESRRYAKRQLTWLRRNKDIFWIRWEKTPDIELGRHLSTEFLNQCGLL